MFSRCIIPYSRQYSRPYSKVLRSPLFITISLFSFLVTILSLNPVDSAFVSISASTSVMPPSTSSLTTAISQLQPQDPNYASQQSALSTIDLEKAWDITTGSKNIIVAVIDDAIDINHPDLRDNIGPGWDFVDDDDDPSPESCRFTGNTIESHGTKVAGVIGAVANNSIGISGVNWNVTIMPLRIGCDFRSDRELLAIKYAIAQGADIINLSYGSPITSNFVQGSFDNLKKVLAGAQKEVLVVVSAGNYEVSNDDVGMYPANINLDNVISVAASDNNKQLTQWSQYGAASVDVAAPGVAIKTTSVKKNFNDAQYEDATGTSFAAPIVSGVAALLKAKNLQDGGAELTPADIKAILQASVSTLSQQKGVLKTDGLINAANALSLLHLPRPVMTVETIQYDDSSAVTSNLSVKNGFIDPNESGMVHITLKNLWDNVVSATVTLATEDKTISIASVDQNIGLWSKGDLKRFSFQINTGAFEGHKRFPFKISIQAIGEQETSLVTRDFFINTGILQNEKKQNGLIQKNRFDDYQYFHFNVPFGSQKVAVEVTYDKNDTRDVGVLASLNEKPKIYFAKRNFESYWFRADQKSDALTGFERIDLNLPSIVQNTESSVLNVLVFNAPAESISQTFVKNKAFTIKACGFSDSDGNVPPVVSVGIDQTVLAGTKVTLTALVSDNDGKITRQWWRALDGTPFTLVNETQLTFIAPTIASATGEVRFTYTAIDDGCKLSRDTVVIKIQDESGEIPDFQLNPPKITIEESSSIDLVITASYRSRIIDDISLASTIEGVSFIKNSRGNRGNRLIWKNARSIGVTKIRFTANIDGESKNGFILVDVKRRGESNRGGGCTTIAQGRFDPLFLIYVFLSFYFLIKRPKNNTNTRVKV